MPCPPGFVVIGLGKGGSYFGSWIKKPSAFTTKLFRTHGKYADSEGFRAAEKRREFMDTEFDQAVWAVFSTDDPDLPVDLSLVGVSDGLDINLKKEAV